MKYFKPLNVLILLFFINSCSNSDDNQSLSCETFLNNNTLIIPTERQVVMSSLSINQDFVISDLNVTVNIRHQFPRALELFLIAPDGTEIVLASETDIITSGDTSERGYFDTIFDDEADNSIESLVTNIFVTGTYKPIGNLSDFNEQNTSGNWMLKIIDNSDFNDFSTIGNLENWSLEICGF